MNDTTYHLRLSLRGQFTAAYRLANGGEEPDAASLAACEAQIAMLLEEEWLTISEAATRREVKRVTLQAWLQRGAFPRAVRTGIGWLIPARDVDAYRPEPAGWPKGRAKPRRT